MDEGVLLYWETQRYVKQGLEMGVCFCRGPAFWEHGWVLLSWGASTGQMPCRRVSLSIGALLGYLEGVCLLGLLREKKKYTWVPFLDPEAIKILSLGAIWNF